MWLENKPIQYPEDISYSTRNFFKENEGKQSSIKGVDPDSLYDKNHPDELLDNTQHPWIPVPIDVPWQDIYKEAKHLLDTGCFTVHRPDSSGWLSLCVHGMSTVHTNVPHDYDLPDNWEEDHSHWTDIARYCPKTVEWLKEVVKYENYTRVRFMVVLPGGWLGQHTDRDSVYGVGATNVAINNPDECALVMKDWGVMPFTPGSVFKINTGYQHAVWNRSDEPRIHMILDGEMGPEFKRKVLEGYDASIQEANKQEI